MADNTYIYIRLVPAQVDHNIFTHKYGTREKRCSLYPKVQNIRTQALKPLALRPVL
jgi:hypothetical protein